MYLHPDVVKTPKFCFYSIIFALKDEVTKKLFHQRFQIITSTFKSGYVSWCYKGFIPIILFMNLLVGQALDSRYHTLPEIEAILDSLDQIEAYDNIYHLETIGYSTHENLPIKAVKISDNADVKEDEARVLFLGQCHAEEILGVEAVIELIYYLLDPPSAAAQHVNILRQNLEIWIVPTYNPEGLNVVHAGLDVSYRKNKHDFSPSGPEPNGVFDYDPAIGNDIDGVDLNRNYDFNWAFGDTFMEPDPSDYAAHYDYYKGIEPWSESEVTAIRDLAMENDFMFSIAWHSSRSGRLSEKVFTSWRWEDTKFPPDTEEMTTIGDELASRLVKEDGVENYESVYGGTRNGKAHDWFYAATGCFQFLIECGTANLQPDSAIIENTIDRLMPAQIYLLDRAVGYNEDAGQITGIVRDGAGNVLEDVEVKVLEKHGGVQTQRKTDEFGRFRRILNPGTYLLQFRKFGYEETTIQATANNSAIYEMDLLMTPKIMYEISFVLNDLWSDVRVKYDNGIFSGELDANLAFELPEGEWDLTVYVMAEAYEVMPWTRTIDVDRDMQIIPNFEGFSPIELSISDSSWWNLISGSWIFDEEKLLTNSNFLYSNNDSLTLSWELESPWIDVSGSNRIVVEMSHQYEVEWDHDSIQVSLLDADGEIARRVWKDQNWNEMVKSFIWVNDTSGFDSIKVQLSFGRDQTVAYRGWQIESMNLFHGYEQDLSIQSGSSFSPINLGTASSAYPNPFTGRVAIDLDNWREPVNITVYNLLGQEIYRERLAGLSPQRQTWRFDLQSQLGTPVSSGVYFIRITGNKKEFIRKCVFLKP